MLINYKPFLLNDLFQLYLQQKFNINSSRVVYSFNVNYFLDQKEADSIDLGYFERIFEEVHLTIQESGEYLLELFDLKDSILQDFDNSYEQKILDASYMRIIDFLHEQELLLNKSADFGCTRTKKLETVTVNDGQPDLYMSQLLEKYLYLKTRQEIPFLRVPTPYLKRNKLVERKITSYFSACFQEIQVQIIEIDGIDYIKTVQLSELKEEYLSYPIDDFLEFIY